MLSQQLPFCLHFGRHYESLRTKSSVLNITQQLTLYLHHKNKFKYGSKCSLNIIWPTAKHWINTIFILYSASWPRSVNLPGQSQDCHTRSTAQTCGWIHPACPAVCWLHGIRLRCSGHSWHQTESAPPTHSQNT